MKNLIFSSQFKKDYKLILKQRKDIRKIKAVLYDLVMDNDLPKELLDHTLNGQFINHREVHIEPDWLLIYEIRGNEINLRRTGSHSDLF